LPDDLTSVACRSYVLGNLALVSVVFLVRRGAMLCLNAKYRLASIGPEARRSLVNCFLMLTYFWNEVWVCCAEEMGPDLQLTTPRTLVPGIRVACFFRSAWERMMWCCSAECLFKAADLGDRAGTKIGSLIFDRKLLGNSSAECN
jgi:hypothetical protein